MAWLVTIALAHALAFFTYYLAPFIAAAHAAVLVWVRRVDRRVVIAFVIGVVAGAPAFILGLVTLVRDWGARDVARAFPALAWGEHGSLQMAMQMGRRRARRVRPSVRRAGVRSRRRSASPSAAWPY